MDNMAQFFVFIAHLFATAGLCVERKGITPRRFDKVKLSCWTSHPVYLLKVEQGVVLNPAFPCTYWTEMGTESCAHMYTPQMEAALRGSLVAPQRDRWAPCNGSCSKCYRAVSECECPTTYGEEDIHF